MSLLKVGLKDVSNVFVSEDIYIYFFFFWFFYRSSSALHRRSSTEILPHNWGTFCAGVCLMCVFSFLAVAGFEPTSWSLPCELWIFVRGMESVLDTTGIIILTITYIDRIDHLNEDDHYYYFVSNCSNFLSGQHSHNSIIMRGQMQNVFSQPRSHNDLMYLNQLS